ncbi:MAG: carboxymuconolactone decarboxylase family protein [Armatimonadota bacterium]
MPTQSAVFPASAAFVVAEADSLEAPGRVPDVLRAVAGANPDAAATLARLVRTVLFGGTLPPSMKLAMGVRIARQLRTGYALAHLERLARAAGPVDDPRTEMAVRYGLDLTRDIHGVGDEAFAQVSARFNDAQVVELTMTTCFLNYFTRLTAGLGVVPEPWLATSAPRIPKRIANAFAPARVCLSSDDELKMAGPILERWGPGGAGASSLGVGIPNSVRAMVRVPDLYDAWLGRWQAPGSKPAVVPRTTLLQVSLAVSTINGCRYCVLHQVSGLRRQGVDIKKLVALRKDDSALAPDEKAAVDFARKLTKDPAGVVEADRTALAAHFPGPAAFEILQQTCRFAFMNRFTDGLRLPSEDEAVHVYRETYGRDFQGKGDR